MAGTQPGNTTASLPGFVHEHTGTHGFFLSAKNAGWLTKLDRTDELWKIDAKIFHGADIRCRFSFK